MREETGVQASILKLKDPIGESQSERVMVLQGIPSQIGVAVNKICTLLVSNAQEREAKKELDAPVMDTNGAKITLLVDHTQAGAVIGKAGATIKKTQTDTGARMQVSKDPLPGSSERSVQISGTPDVIHNALDMVLAQLAEYPSTNQSPKLYVPGDAAPVHPAHPTPPFDPYGYSLQGQQQSYYAQAPGFPAADPAMMYQHHPAAPVSAHSAPPPAHHGGVTAKQQIAIPTACAGGVIGKQGHRIRDIQAQSGTVVQIAAAEAGNPKERVVTISGSQVGIQIAIQLIQHAVQTEYATQAS